MLKKVLYMTIILSIILSSCILEKTYAVSNCKVTLNCSESLEISQAEETKTITLKIEPNNNEISGFLINVHATNNITIESVNVFDESKYEVQDNAEKNNVLISTLSNQGETYITEPEEICKINIKVNNVTDDNYAYLYLDFDDGYSSILGKDSVLMENIETNKLVFKAKSKENDGDIDEGDWVPGEDENLPHQDNGDENQDQNPDNTTADKPISDTGEQFGIGIGILFVIIIIAVINIKRRK